MPANVERWNYLELGLVKRVGTKAGRAALATQQPQE